MTAQLGSMMGVSSSGLTLVVADNQPWDDSMGGSGFRDVFLASVRERFVWEGTLVAQFALHLEDRSGAVFDDDGLPRWDDALTADDFPDGSWVSISGWNADDMSQEYALRGTIDSISVTPEPATLTLLAAVFLAGRRSSRDRRGSAA